MIASAKAIISQHYQFTINEQIHIQVLEYLGFFMLYIIRIPAQEYIKPRLKPIN
jgi:hypothetical protein